MPVIEKNFADGTIRDINAPDSAVVGIEGGPSERRWHKRSMLKVKLGVAAGGGGVAAVANPFGRRVLIGRVFLDVTTGVAQTADIGVAANGTTSSDTLLDGVSIATGIYDNADNKGTNGLYGVAWSATQFVTATASGTPTGLVGNLYIEVIDP